MVAYPELMLAGERRTWLLAKLADLRGRTVVVVKGHRHEDVAGDPEMEAALWNAIARSMAPEDGKGSPQDAPYKWSKTIYTGLDRDSRPSTRQILFDVLAAHRDVEIVGALVALSPHEIIPLRELMASWSPIFDHVTVLTPPRPRPGLFGRQYRVETDQATGWRK